MNYILSRIVLCYFILFSSSGVFANSDYLFFSGAMIATHMKDYNEEEKEAIEKDLKVVRSVSFCNAETKPKNIKPIYLASAGAPGSRKSTIFERFMKNHLPVTHFVYLDPDQRALKFMAHTYTSQSLSALAIAEAESYPAAIKRAYEKWRGASNYITLTLLEEAFLQGKNIAHGSTSTGDHMSSFLPKIKERGYEIKFVLCSAEDSFRYKAVQYRNEEQRFYQSTPEDVVSKGKAFPLRMPIYFTYGDELYLFWSDDLQHPEKLAAVFTNGKLDVVDLHAYESFVNKYSSDRLSLLKEGKELLEWNELIALYQRRFQ